MGGEERVEVVVWVHLESDDDPGAAPETYRVVVVSEELRGRRGKVSSRAACGWADYPHDVAAVYREAMAWLPADALMNAPQVRSVGVPVDLLADAFRALDAAPRPLPAWRQVSEVEWRAGCEDDRTEAVVRYVSGCLGWPDGWYAAVGVGRKQRKGPAFADAESARAWCEREVWL
jgi:hypothetical protein